MSLFMGLRLGTTRNASDAKRELKGFSAGCCFLLSCWLLWVYKFMGDELMSRKTNSDIDWMGLLAMLALTVGIAATIKQAFYG